jgi:dTDP-4-dehydrorhamnose reductase
MSPGNGVPNGTHGETPNGAHAPGSSGPARPILLFGASGQLAWELRRTLAVLGKVIALDHARADFSDVQSLRAIVRETRPSLTVNAVALTRPDVAERSRELTHLVNAAAPIALAEESARLGAPFIHYSSDYVFDGRASAPYAETAAPGPLNVYGESKVAGEQGIAAVGGPHLVFRVSWVYGTRGVNFMRAIRQQARERALLRVVADQHGAPTWCRAIAEATAAVASQMRSDGGFALDEPRWGIYHLSAAGQTTWYEFARAILRDDPARHEHLCREVQAITTEEWAATARRPQYSVLDNGRVRREFGIALPGWEEQLALVNMELAEQGTAAARA